MYISGKFTIMKKLSFLVILTVALSNAYAPTYASIEPAKGSSTVNIKPKSWTGYISDSHCGIKGSKEGHVDCANKCIKEGAAPVLVVGKKIYTFSNPDAVLEHAGHKVKITGTVAKDVITVTNVSAV